MLRFFGSIDPERAYNYFIYFFNPLSKNSANSFSLRVNVLVPYVVPSGDIIEYSGSSMEPYKDSCSLRLEMQGSSRLSV